MGVEMCRRCFDADTTARAKRRSGERPPITMGFLALAKPAVKAPRPARRTVLASPSRKLSELDYGALVWHGTHSRNAPRVRAMTPEDVEATEEERAQVLQALEENRSPDGFPAGEP